MIDPDNHWEVSILDFDNAQRSWYMIDLGTLIEDLQMTLQGQLRPYVSKQAYSAWFNQFYFWITDEYGKTYGSPVDPAELTQGCEWRAYFIYDLFK